ncbi:PAS domain-containing sensor histidine kinase [Mesorhizobium sp. ASY16-5R]|uniref:PAS domain-containing sensor histidine kinase n=1 Tax=Mesorhizobium sp. ASY16-5R TaxID=3445772 RepID=UPI003F9F1122
MKALPLQTYGRTIVASGAGLLLFWLFGELVIAESNIYARMALLAGIAVATGILIQDLQVWRAPERARYDTHEIVESMPGLAWAAGTDGRLNIANAHCREYFGTADIMREAIHPQDLEKAAGLWSRSLASGEDFRSSHRFRGPDGTYRWFRAVARARRDRKGAAIGWIGTLIDIDDQKLAEERLRASEAGLRAILDNIPGIIATADPQGNHDYANRKNRDYFGMDWPEFTGHGWLKIIHPEERDGVAAAWRQSVQSGEPMDVIHRLQRFDGEYRWFRARVEPAFDNGGKVERWYGLITDAHAQKRAEEALEAREHQLQQFIDAIPTLVWSARSDGFAEFLNERWIEYTGLPREQAIGWGWTVAVHPDDRDRLVGYWRSLLAAGAPGEIEARLRRSDGKYRWFLFRGEPVRDASGAVARWFGSNADIDDLKRAEEALRARERDLRQFVDAIPAMICVLTPDGEPSYVNKRLMDYVGIAELEDLGVPDHGRLANATRNLVHPDDQPHVKAALGRSFESGEPFIYLHRVRRSDGEYRWVEARGEPFRDGDGQILRWYSVNVDVDERQKAEEGLRARQRELESIIETIPSLVWSVTPDGEPAYINKRLADYYGRTIDHSHTVEGSNLTWSLQVLMHPDDLPAIHANLLHSLSTGTPFAMRYRNRRADGVYRWVDARAEPLRDDDGRIVKWYGVSTDIDDEIKAQEALRGARDKLSRASQIASLAELSASIAHEVNQPLAAVVTNSHALRRWLSADPPNIEQALATAERIVRNSMTAAEVVRRIRTLFKQKASTRTHVDLNEVIAEVHQLMIDTVKSEGVLLEVLADTALPHVLADRVQMQQVLVNLIRNGIDAMKANTDAPKSLVVRSCWHGADIIRVEVRDNGVGIDEPGRIFEPFFTTKEEGMGMGLAICRSILESHEGALWAERVDPRGTVFSFTLPAQPTQAA